MASLGTEKTSNCRRVAYCFGTCAVFLLVLVAMLVLMTGCSLLAQDDSEPETSSGNSSEVYYPTITEEPTIEEPTTKESTAKEPTAEELLKELDLTVSYRPSLSHGPKTAAYQKYIVLHDTEGNGSPQSVVDWWEGNGNLIAAQFVIGKDGSIVQCVPLDEIAHHAGFGNAGHNKKYGVTEDGRDDMRGTKAIGLPDYGMNAWSVGIELVHSGDATPYPEAQLEALDNLIAYIDAYYGFESTIIDHKAWRKGNSDTSSAFSTYLSNYQSTRTHDGH